MWKKDEAAPEPQRSPAPAPAPATRAESAPSVPAAKGRASIGTSITIRGEVTGDEDLLIEGRVDGSVDLKQHTVTVGAEGQVKAGISGRVVTVEGTVHGDLRAEEMVVLRSTAQVEGDITAPRVVLEDGASFRGAVDMGEVRAGSARDGARSTKDRAVTPSAKPVSPADPTPSAKGSGDATATAVSR